MYSTHSLIVIDPCAKYDTYLNVKANRSYRLDMKTWQKPVNLRSEVKIQSGTWMYVSHHIDRPMCQNGKQKPYKFDTELKLQGPIWIMNVRNTSPHSDISIYQIWLVNVKSKTRGPWATSLTRKIVTCFLHHFTNSFLSPLLEGCDLIWKILNSLYPRILYDKYGWHWSSRSEEVDF